MPMKTADAMPAASRTAPTVPPPWRLRELLGPLLDSLPRQPHPDGLYPTDLDMLAALVGDVVDRAGPPPEGRNEAALYRDRVTLETRWRLRATHTPDADRPECLASSESQRLRWAQIDRHLALTGSAFLPIGLIGTIATAHVNVGTTRQHLLRLREQVDTALRALDGEGRR